MTFSKCLMVTAIPLLAVCAVRNSYWEFCTTTAYGYPFPWWTDYCPCEKGKTSINPWFCGANLLIWMGAALILARFVGGLLGRKN